MKRTTRLAAVAAGLAADRVLGEPPARLHPVAGFGAVMQRAEPHLYQDDRAHGVLYAAMGVSLATASATVMSKAWGGSRWPATATAAYLTVAGKALTEAARGVSRHLEVGDLDAARRALPALVGRDPAGLGEKEMARAVIESVAENTVDAVVAPALWAAVGGPHGVFAYRAINTLDAMVGHRSARYGRFGWAAARTDDVAAWVPARATAALVAAVRPRRAKSIWRAVRHDAPSHPSPNAGVAEAAFAAALGITLGGTNVYSGRVELRPDLACGPRPSVSDIARAVRLSGDVTAALAVALVMPSVASWLRSPR